MENRELVIPAGKSQLTYKRGVICGIIVDESLHSPVETLIIAMFYMKNVSLQTDSRKISR